MKRKLALLALMSLLLISLICSCGSPKTLVTVKNNADGTNTKISISQGDGGSTSVSVVPSVSASLDSINFDIKSPRSGGIVN